MTVTLIQKPIIYFLIAKNVIFFLILNSCFWHKFVIIQLIFLTLAISLILNIMLWECIESASDSPPGHCRSCCSIDDLCWKLFARILYNCAAVCRQGERSQGSRDHRTEEAAQVGTGESYCSHQRGWVEHHKDRNV